MTEPDQNIPIAHRVTTVTKHIKIYSDNPIHDCIDRLITACEWIDDPNLDEEYGYDELAIVAEQLFVYAYKQSMQATLRRIYKKDEQRTN
jgi:hypothetical protein